MGEFLGQKACTFDQITSETGSRTYDAVLLAKYYELVEIFISSIPNDSYPSYFVTKDCKKHEPTGRYRKLHTWWPSYTVILSHCYCD
jgi:hypothetical protein